MAISIMIVDDHKIMAEGLRHLIETHDDMRVVGCVADGRAALREAAALKPEVVIMDISMPELNGIEATHLMRSRMPDTQIVILSMHSNREYVMRALQAGARGYLLKKSAGQDVVNAIRAVHGKGHYLSPEIAENVLDEYLKSGANGSPLDALSSRERQVLQLVAEGRPGAAIAESLSLSPKTVETYRARIMQKLGIHDMPSLVKFAIQHGLTPLE